MRRRFSPMVSLILGLSVVVVTAGLTACGRQSDLPAVDGTKPAQDPLMISLTPEMDKRFQMASVVYRDITPMQSVPGRIEANERLVTRIGASVTGRITDVMVDVGDRIVVGQALAKIASPELSQNPFGLCGR